ncbi:MAG: TlpA disulfide reductase family protein, partial [Actinomycetota bacterium]
RNRAPSPSSRTPLLVVGGIVVVCILALVAVVVGSSGDDSDETAAGVEQQRPVNLSGQPLVPLGSGADPAVGQPVPVVEGAEFDGTELTIGPGTGPALVTFLAHWCPHCQREVPRLVEQFGGQDVVDGVQIVAVATGTDSQAPNYPPSVWLDDEGWIAPTLADDESSTAGTAFGLAGFPYFVAIDGNGNVAARASGELDEAQVDALLAAARGS